MKPQVSPAAMEIVPVSEFKRLMNPKICLRINPMKRSSEIEYKNFKRGERA
jgi:hypothetical protein